jgi:hypothetical protein
MKLGISFDKHGNIVTLFNTETLKSSKGTLQYVPAKGENHHVIDLPQEFEGEAFENLPAILRVNASGSHPRLERKKA